MRTLETERLILTKWTTSKEDIEGLYEFAKNPEVGPNAGWKPHADLAESRMIIEEIFMPYDVWCIREKATGKVFIFATTHLWWKTDSAQAGSSEVRRKQTQLACELIAKYQAKYDNCPVIFVGDMNDHYDSKAIQYALSEGGFKHAHDVATDYRDEGVGYNDCGINKKAPGVWRDEPFVKAIDHILVKDMPEGAVKRFDRYCPDYYLVISDHAPVYIDLAL